MSYRFRLDENFESGFRRIALEQIVKAERELIDPDDLARAVHEARKCLKRIRSLLRLGRPGLSTDDFRTANGHFRDTAALMSGARDQHVLTETLAKLEQHSRRGKKAAFAIVRDVIAATGDGQSGRDLDQRRAEAIDRLKAGRRLVQGLSVPDDGIDIATDGLARTYKSGRQALRTAYDTLDDEAFHDWRKAVQHHWRHMLLLSHGWPEYFTARAAAARDLAHTIGEDHDLAVLAATAERLNNTAGSSILDLCRTRQTALRTAARLRGERLFADGSRRLKRRVGLYWTLAGRMAADDGLDVTGASRDKDRVREQQAA